MNAAGDASVLAVFTPREPAFRHLFAALGQRCPLTALWPVDGGDLLRWLGGTHRQRRVPLRPLPFWPWKGEAPSVLRPWLRRLARRHGTVIFTRPDQAALLPWFPNARKVYYALDDYRFYGRDWNAEEITLLREAGVIVAVSERLGEVFCRSVPSVAERLLILPNAVPEGWIPAGPPLPRHRGDRPVVGIVGHVSSRLRLDWLAEAAARTPSLHWQFAGGVEEGELLPEDLPHLKALERLANCSFTGPKSYEELAAYARRLDVALLPYSARSVNPCASPMRLFLHLAFGQPLLATPGCDLLETFDPLVTMCRSADALVEALEALQKRNFDDGLIEQRRREGARHTWSRRAEALLDQLREPAIP